MIQEDAVMIDVEALLAALPAPAPPGCAGSAYELANA